MAYYEPAPFTEQEIVYLDIKELNKKIKQKRLCEDEIKEIKSIRRKRRLKSYDLNRNRRGKALLQSLETERDSLQEEYENLMIEVEQLHDSKMKLELLSLLDNYS
ncbi:hypothetical protein LOD99_14003 [Oopsacas minuta]|uniref:Basic leucine zipper domain-containing protein n=1 Tax=Oopsacas minuta TaxID=111878 RepID=A0AAV7KGK3_9METZ|nr:hypothetical protein LOD99_14003 [Oopsacas minuta]